MNCSIEQALDSVFWYEGLISRYDIDDGFDPDSVILQMIRGLRAAESIYTFEMLPEDFDWQHRHTVIWQILVEMFGNCGTSPRTGWIEDTKECADFLEKIIYESY